MPLRNFVNRRQHKERGQLSHRKKFGLLEKHKDYVQRARDHHSKRDRIKRLREKALLEKNKDEFYFGMIKGRVEKGIHYSSRGNEPIATPIVSLMKTQDASYIRRQLTSETKRIERLIQELAPNVSEMRIEWLKEKPKRMEALKEAGLIKSPSKKGRKQSKRSALGGDDDDDDEDEDRKIGNQGKKTVWVDDAKELKSYAGPSSLKPQTSTNSSNPNLASAPAFRSMNDIEEDLEDLEGGEFLDADGLADAESLFAEEQQHDDEQDDSSLSQERIQRRREKHSSYLLTLLSARQARHRALSTALQHLNTVTALMNNKGSSVKKVTSKDEQTKNQMIQAIAQGKMSKHGLAMPGHEDSDDDDEDQEINGRKKKPKAVWKFGKERKR
ncbi:unnamed protein product [Sympodiomycopsis kandeliae]